MQISLEQPLPTRLPAVVVAAEIAAHAGQTPSPDCREHHRGDPAEHERGGGARGDAGGAKRRHGAEQGHARERPGERQAVPCVRPFGRALAPSHHRRAAAAGVGRAPELRPHGGLRYGQRRRRRAGHRGHGGGGEPGE